MNQVVPVQVRWISARAVWHPRSGSEAVGARAELRLVVRLQDGADHFLQQLVRPGRDPQHTTPLDQPSSGFVTITHPHHPLRGQRVEVVRVRRGADPDLIVRCRMGAMPPSPRAGPPSRTGRRLNALPRPRRCWRPTASASWPPSSRASVTAGPPRTRPPPARRDRAMIPLSVALGSSSHGRVVVIHHPARRPRPGLGPAHGRAPGRAVRLLAQPGLQPVRRPGRPAIHGGP